jgi:hypothetical protein
VLIKLLHSYVFFLLELSSKATLHDLYGTISSILSLSLDHISSTHFNERGTDLTLQQISEFIEDGGHKLKDFGLPEPTFRSPEVLNELEAFEDQHELLFQQVNDMIEEMVLEKQEFFNLIYSSITLHENDPEHHPTPPPFFIEGKPGRGKSFLADALACKFRANVDVQDIVYFEFLSKK